MKNRIIITMTATVTINMTIPIIISLIQAYVSENWDNFNGTWMKKDVEQGEGKGRGGYGRVRVSVRTSSSTRLGTFP